MKRKGLVGEIKIDSLPSVSDFLCFLPLLLFNEICASPSLHVLFIYSIFFHSFSGSFFLSLTRSFVNEHHEYILPHPTCRRFSFVFSFISFFFCSAYFIVSFALFYIFIVILFAFPSLSFCLVLSLHFCIFIFISPIIFLLLRVCSSN